MEGVGVQGGKGIKWGWGMGNGNGIRDYIHTCKIQKENRTLRR